MNECHCPTPPGGRVVCADHQTAICVVDPQGNVTTGCMDRPQTAVTQQQAENWILQEVTGEVRAPGQTITNTDRAVLQTGRYERKDGTKVTFRLPRDGSWPNDFGFSRGSPQGGFNPPPTQTLSG